MLSMHISIICNYIQYIYVNFNDIYAPIKGYKHTYLIWLIGKQAGKILFVIIFSYFIQLRLSRSRGLNTSAKSLLGVPIINTETEQNLVSRDLHSRFIFIGKQDLI